MTRVFGLVCLVACATPAPPEVAVSASPVVAEPAAPAPPASDPECRADADCTLTTWACSPCGTCPGFPPHAIGTARLEAQRADCRWEKPPPKDAPAMPPPACAPCPSVTREPPVTRAVCDLGRCRAIVTDVIDARPAAP